MKMNNFLQYIIFYVLIVRTQELINSVNKDDYPSDEIVNIVGECFNGRTSHNIVIGYLRDLKSQILKKMSSSLISICLIDSPTQEVSRDFSDYDNHLTINESIVSEKYRCGVNDFVVFASTNENLTTHLETLKQSIWWDIEASFLIVNLKVGGCETAIEFLHILWIYNILSTILLCFNENRTVIVYTYNPYNNFAPGIWEPIYTMKSSDNGSWTAFQKPLNIFNSSYSTLCENLMFDKTEMMHGHTIRMGAYVHSHLLIYNPNNTGLERFGGVNGDITHSICEHLNVTIDVKFYKKMGQIDDNGYYHGFLKDLESGEIDFAMNMNILRSTWKQQTYPHESSGFCIVSLKTPVPFMIKFKSIFTVQFWYTLGLSSIAAVFALTVFLKQPFVSAIIQFLEVLLTQTTLKEPPDELVKRLLFLSIIMLTMITNLFIQSQLSSINVAPNTYPTMNNIEDLSKSKCPIYGTLSSKELFSDSHFTHRYKLSEYPKCLEHLSNGELIVCIPGCIEAKFGAYENERIHISKHELRHFLMAFSVRKDWPLRRKFNRLLRHLSEAGIIRLFRIREAKYFKQNLNLDSDPKGISLKNIKFSFIVLNVGLAIGFFILLVELLLDFMGKRFLITKEIMWSRLSRSLKKRYSL